MMVDKETQLKNVSVGDAEIVYTYSLINYSSVEVDAREFLTEMTPSVRNWACTSPDMKAFWKNGISVRYTYSGNDNRFIGDIRVRPSDCEH